MKHEEIGRRLREGDPLKGARPLDDRRVAAMRSTILREARTARPVPVLRFALAGALAAIAVWVAFRWAPLPPPAPSAVETARQERQTRQMQFTTPGGTRVVWVFDSEFDPGPDSEE